MAKIDRGQTMNISVVINIIGALLQLIVGYEIGDMTANALAYTTTRGQAFKDGFIILGCILVRLFIDRYIFRRKETESQVIDEDIEDEEAVDVAHDNEEGFSPLILDIVTYVLGTIIIVAILGMFGKDTISVTLAAMLLSFVLLLIKDIDTYFLPDYSSVIGVPEAETVDAEDEVDAVDTVAEVDDENAPEGDDEPNTEDDSDIDDESVTDESDTEDESGKEDIEDEVDEEAYLEARERNNRIFTQVTYILSAISFMMLGVLVLGDIQSGSFGVLYYFVIFLVAALSVLFRFMYRSFKSMVITPEPGSRFFAGFSTKDDMIGCIVLSLIIALFLAHRSILVGFVYLLGVAVARVIIPVAFDNWGTGGTRVVNRNKLLLARFSSRVFSLIIIMLAVWLLSYGGVWEIEYLTLIAVAVTKSEKM